MKDSGIWRVKKYAEKRTRKDALGVRKKGYEGEMSGRRRRWR